MARHRNGYAQWVPVITFFLLLLGCGGGGGSNSGTGTPVSLPASPMNLQATAASSTTVNLTWTDNSNNEDGFLVYRGMTPNTVTTLAAALPANSTGYTDTGLSPSTNYWYKVSAYNSAGGVDAPTVPNVSTQPVPLAPPAVPSNLQATAASSTAIDLTWVDNSNNEEGFRIYFGTDSSNVTTLVATLGPGSTSYQHTGRVVNTTYYYKVTAYNTAGESAASNFADATTQPVPVSPPAAPSTLQATAASVSAINLTWVDNSNNEDGFRVYFGTDSSNVTNLVATLGAGITSYQHTGLAASTTYYYKVTAYNTAGPSAASNVANATTQAPPVVVPAAPSTLQSTAASSSAINLTWVDNSNNEDGFRVYRGADSSNVATLVATLGAGITSYQNTGLTPSMTYYYKVTAYNTAEESAASNVANAATSPDPPAAPSTLQATAASSSAINLTWVDNSNNEDGFRVYRGTDSSNVATLMATLGAGITSYQNTGLAASTTYYYKVTAYNTAGASAASNIANATTNEDPPAAPSGLQANAASSSAINLTWVDNSNNEVGFRVYSGADSSSVATLVATLGAGVTSYQHTGLTASTTYYYKVTAYNTAGPSAASNIVNATTNASSGAIKSFAAGTSHVLLVKMDGTLWAWGDNFSGQLGSGTTTDNSSPVRVGTDTNWAYVSAGENHSVAVKTDGTLWAWGNNDAGQLGIGSTAGQNVPVQVGGDNNWASVSAGGSHTVARKMNGTLWAWGNNDAGQLGIGSTAGQNVPVQVGSDTDWASVSAGGNHTVAVKMGGGLWAWGDNFSGQLGDGTIVNRILPLRIGTENWVSVSAGNAHTVARRTDGSI